MNHFETNCVPPPQNLPTQKKQNTYFLTTNQPLAVQENTKNVKHASSTVSRRVFGPNDMVVMTTWVEKVTFSTVKSTTVGKPVVSDSVRIPSAFVSCAGCQTNNICLQPQPSTESSIPCPVPGTCDNPGCKHKPRYSTGDLQPSTSASQPCTTDTQPSTSDSQTIPSLTQMASQMEEESQDQNEMCTDSEDEECSDSQDEESDSIDV